MRRCTFNRRVSPIAQEQIQRQMESTSSAKLAKGCLQARGGRGGCAGGGRGGGGALRYCTDHSPVGHSGISGYFGSGTQPRPVWPRRSSLCIEIYHSLLLQQIFWTKWQCRQRHHPCGKYYCVCLANGRIWPLVRMLMTTGYTLSRHAFLATRPFPQPVHLSARGHTRVHAQAVVCTLSYWVDR